MVLENLPHPVNTGIAPVTQSKTSRPTVVRKKFAKPPVKVACLTCRASRTRCDGQEPCSNCLSKKKKCSYLPSRRGGPRKKKKSSSPSDSGTRQDDLQNSSLTPASGLDDSSAMFGQIDVLSLPGAGLRSLDFSSDVNTMFADLFPSDNGSNTQGQMGPTPSPSNIPSQPLVRTYGSEHDILNAYYDFIHHYFPILPPRVAPRCPDRPINSAGHYSSSPSGEPLLAYKPQSPLSLAISAILALVPHPDDPEPLSPVAVLRRRTYAHTFAQLANAGVEEDCELQASSTDPSQALSNSRPRINREPFHPRTPVELESLLALLILCVYEYTQRGNLLKMRYRAGQALAIALDMSLQSLGEEHDECAEARRRAWWMTYYCVLQGSIVSTTPLSIIASDPQFVTPYPRFSADPEGWAVLMQAQQVLASATQFVIDLKKCMSTGANMTYIYERMQQLDAWASSAIAQSNLLPMVPQSMGCGDEVEYTTAHSIRAIARIKLSSAQIKVHRFRAFSDIPLFIKKHCDLTAANPNNMITGDSASKASKEQDSMANISCCCSNLDSFRPPPSTSSDCTASASSSGSATSDYHSMVPFSFTSGFPYSSQHSAKVCLKASLTISRMFPSLPLPQPLYASSGSNTPSQGLPSSPQKQLPRTMPSFACCLMQGSYALLMIFYKATVEKQMSPDYGNESTNSASDRLIEEIRQGLERVIETVKNYAIAFEALDGMRDEIEGAYHTAFPPV
ncbi:maltose fermentation regulatory protein MAL13 [Aspergillus udagawae]|uniref:Maltose fermentation regulatory protein MAL13 n=1 Tax=Aspergillus udagawae TaxID=91492 RepID=A0ABQ1BE82_9EURO|nr:maltose fermentation regulatory protein MAL13 [Aspergillus udagawae]GFF99799.1 maltose fermentation regulatory protein MAL13 [Aspergillus udagawae]GFG19173.1 maltose fermentation regulatory protein MAL13 [Aspergillus udagawae]